MNNCSLTFRANNLPTNVLFWTPQSPHLKQYTFSVIAESSYNLSSEKVYTSSMTILNSKLDYNLIKLSQIIEIDGREFSRRYERLVGTKFEES